MGRISIKSKERKKQTEIHAISIKKKIWKNSKITKSKTGKISVSAKSDKITDSKRLPNTFNGIKSATNKEKKEDIYKNKEKKPSFFGSLFKKKSRLNKKIENIDEKTASQGSCEKGATKTKVDEIMEAVEECGKIKIDELSKKTGVEKQRIEGWVKILEEHELVSIHYTILGNMEVRRPETKKKAVDSNEDDE